MNGQLLHVGHKGLSLSKGSVPTLCPPWGAIPGSAPAARAQGSGLAARAACGRYSHSHHKLWMDTGYLILHPRGQSPFIKKCHSAAPIHKRRWWHFQSRTNPQFTMLVERRMCFRGVYPLWVSNVRLCLLIVNECTCSTELSWMALEV